MNKLCLKRNRILNWLNNSLDHIVIRDIGEASSQKLEAKVGTEVVLVRLTKPSSSSTHFLRQVLDPCSVMVEDIVLLKIHCLMKA